MTENEWTQIEALWTLCAAIFGRNNLIDSDFADVKAWQVKRRFSQDSNGVLIQFCISNHAIGKVTSSQEIADAIDVLVPGSEHKETETHEADAG